MGPECRLAPAEVPAEVPPRLGEQAEYWLRSLPPAARRTFVPQPGGNRQETERQPEKILRAERAFFFAWPGMLLLRPVCRKARLLEVVSRWRGRFP